MPETLPCKAVRNAALIQDRIKGQTYRELAAKYNIASSTVSRTLNKEDIRDIVDQGLIEVIERVPKAINVIDKTIDDYKDNAALAFKASEFILKTATIAPSNVENQTINNIVNVQNNVTLNQGVFDALQGSFDNDDDDIQEGFINE